MSDAAVIDLRNQRNSRDLVLQGSAAVREKRFDEAHRAFVKALDLDRDCVEAHLALARLRFPGEPYVDILSRIHRLVQPKTYVEIGVGNGVSMSRTLPSTQCVGVDPAPSLGGTLPEHIKLIKLKSEDLFGAADPCAALGFAIIDLAFIDGMHLFENALSDFSYLERYSPADGTILIHDCVPFDALTSARVRQTKFWTGDVWRLLPTLKKFRPDLDISVVECAPSGLAIVRRLNAESCVLESERETLLAFGNALEDASPLASFDIRVLPSEWSRIAPLFSAPAP